MKNIIFASLLVICAVISRLLPHPPNFAPIAGMALAGGVYMDKRFALIVPLIALVVSDIFIGFSYISLFVYFSFFLIGLLGLWLHNNKKLTTIAVTTLSSSILFYLITNFGVWALGGYSYTFTGLVECYVAAIPFFHNTLFGDIVYVTVLFGMFELISQKYFIYAENRN
jgi:hypothetical protein